MVIATVVALLVANQVRTIVIRGASNVVAAGSVSLVRGCLDDTGEASLAEVGAIKLKELVADRQTGQNLMGLRIVDAKGIIVFSSAPSEVGVSVLQDERTMAALNGAVDFAIVDDETGDAVVDGDHSVLKVYAPLRIGDDGRVRGVIETYKPYEQIASSVREASLVVVIPILLGAMLSSVGLLWVIHHAGIGMKERDAELESLNERLHDSMLSLEGQSLGTLQALSAAVDEKDAYTARHSLGVTNWAHAIGVTAGLSPVQMATLERAGLLHDIGKIGVPESVLLKPERLTEEEFALIREHPDAGARILETIPFLDDIVNVVRYHHERWDGTGYPEGLSGEKIPYLARVLAVADAYDAMITDRPYRKAMPTEDARAELLACAGTQFDPEVVHLFVQA
jgi:putative nucleotidyltransferase with HDIG domain